MIHCVGVKELWVLPKRRGVGWPDCQLRVAWSAMLVGVC